MNFEEWFASNDVLFVQRYEALKRCWTAAQAEMRREMAEKVVFIPAGTIDPASMKAALAGMPGKLEVLTRKQLEEKYPQIKPAAAERRAGEQPCRGCGNSYGPNSIAWASLENRVCLLCGGKLQEAKPAPSREEYEAFERERDKARAEIQAAHDKMREYSPFAKPTAGNPAVAMSPAVQGRPQPDGKPSAEEMDRETFWRLAGFGGDVPERIK